MSMRQGLAQTRNRQANRLDEIAFFEQFTIPQRGGLEPRLVLPLVEQADEIGPAGRRRSRSTLFE